MSKKCSKCKVIKPLEQIRTNGTNPDGSIKYHSWCLICFKKDYAKKQMKKKELPFELEEEFEIICNENCSYCGEKPNPDKGSVDRIDSKEGYTQTNVTPSCDWCNKMKNDYDVTEFKQKINKIANHNTNLNLIVNLQLIVIGFLLALNLS